MGMGVLDRDHGDGVVGMMFMAGIYLFLHLEMVSLLVLGLKVRQEARQDHKVHQEVPQDHKARHEDLPDHRVHHARLPAHKVRQECLQDHRVRRECRRDQRVQDGEFRLGGEFP